MNDEDWEAEEEEDGDDGRFDSPEGCSFGGKHK